MYTSLTGYAYRISDMTCGSAWYDTGRIENSIRGKEFRYASETDWIRYASRAAIYGHVPEHARKIPIRAIARQITPANFGQRNNTARARYRNIYAELPRIISPPIAQDFYRRRCASVLLAEWQNSFCQGRDFYEFCLSFQLFIGQIATFRMQDVQWLPRKLPN